MAKRKRKGRGFSLGGGGGGGGGLGISGGAKGGLVGQIQAMQQQMAETQEALAEEKVEISAGGGAISIVMTGHQKIESIKIAPEVVDPDDVEMLQDLIMAAVNEAVEATQNLANEKMGSITGGLNLPGLF